MASTAALRLAVWSVFWGLTSASTLGGAGGARWGWFLALAGGVDAFGAGDLLDIRPEESIQMGFSRSPSPSRALTGATWGRELPGARRLWRALLLDFDRRLPAFTAGE